MAPARNRRGATCPFFHQARSIRRSQAPSGEMRTGRCPRHLAWPGKHGHGDSARTASSGSVLYAGSLGKAGVSSVHFGVRPKAPVAPMYIFFSYRCGSARRGREGAFYQMQHRCSQGSKARKGWGSKSHYKPPAASWSPASSRKKEGSRSSHTACPKSRGCHEICAP